MNSIESLFESAVAAHRSGRRQQGIDYCRQVLDSNPEHLGALSLLGRLYMEEGQPKEAINCLSKAAALKPDEAGPLFDLASACMYAGEFEQALEALLEVAKMQPRNPVSHACLGDAYRALREPQKAIGSYRAALDLKPDLVPVEASLGEVFLDVGLFKEAIALWSRLVPRITDSARPRINLATAYFKNGQYDEAEAHYRQATEAFPGEARGFLGLGIALEHQNALDDAAACFAKAVELTPDNAEAIGRLGCAYARLGHFAQAEPLLTRAVELAPDADEFWNALANTMAARGKTAAAEAAAKKVLSLRPDTVLPLVTLGQVCSQQGKFDEGEDWLRKALAREPENIQALTALAEMQRLKPEDGGIEKFQSMLKDAGLDARALRMLHGTVAGLLEKEGRYREAFEHFQASADAYHASHDRYDLEAHLERSDEIVRTFDRALIERLMPYGSDSEQPIFITGMPRSGTTLIEQIVSSHPDVQGGGEPDILEQLAQEAGVVPDGNKSLSDVMTAIEPGDLRDLADEYLARMNMLTGHSARFTDKSISTYSFLGLAAILFPKARFIHCIREPLDTCLSCFIQRFNQPSHAYTHDLQQLALVYRDYLRLMEHWRISIPQTVLDVRYEELARNHDLHTRRIVEYCDLEWDESCLEHHKNERIVHTASAWQVRQPIYASSIGRWKNYADQLGPLRDVIEGATG